MRNTAISIAVTLHVLDKYLCEELLVRERGSIRERTELAYPDYQRFMDDEENALCSFQGAYMQQYSWAEMAIYELQERKDLKINQSKKQKMRRGE